MKIVILLSLDLLLLFGLFVCEVQGDKSPRQQVQGTPYTAPIFDFDVESGVLPDSKVIICKPSSTDVKHPDHSDRFVLLTCEDGGVVLKLNNVEFPEGFMLKVGPAHP